MKVTIFNDKQNFDGSLDLINKGLSKDKKRFWKYEKYVPFLIKKIRSIDRLEKNEFELTKTFFYSGRYNSDILNRFKWNCNKKIAELNRAIFREKNLLDYLSQQKISKMMRSKVRLHVESVKNEYEEIKKNYMKEIYKQERNSEGQKEFLINLTQTPFIEMKTTPLKQSNGKIYQKGVDVMIATDLVHLAHISAYDIAIILSGDTDLIEAVKLVRNLGKIVIIVSYHTPGDHKLSNISDLMTAGDYFLNLRNFTEKDIAEMSDLKESKEK